ncbi:MAG TPA: alpha/beta hydrolase [Candidatus Baltobacteraceae bacterium]|jgi:pimeloyl-ACP methyl ester carboxylesterase
MRASSLAILAASFLVGAAASPLPQGAVGLHLAPCTIGKTKVPSRCGTFVVYEDRAARSGRTIALPVVILNARHPNGRALVWNPGGPGAGSTQFASFIADGQFLKEIDRLRDRYDIAFLDNRGTSGPHYQQCDLAPRAHPDLYFRQTWPDSLLTACRARLARNADLSLYTTNVAADDLDDFRAAMGYPKLVLDGNSYGTYFYLVYIRRHRGYVESAILDGVAPPHILIIPLEDAYGAQLAMNSLAESCKSDLKCNRNFPAFAAHFAALARRFDDGPLEITIQNPVTKRSQKVALSKEVFADRLRQTLYTAGPAAYVPYIVERAYRGDYVPLGRMIDQTTQGLASILGTGLNLSVTCAEDIPFITDDEIARTSAGSFEGDARVRAQQRACKIWNVEPVSADFNQPVRSDVSVLMVSGTDDPTSPQRYGKVELQYLPNGRRALVKGASHGFETPCIDKLKVDFVLAGTAKHLNVDACGGSFARPPFATSMNGF